jgi:methylenetetrahydrofolate dehydrogenase (NADP+)/methenyltetrahydrofolate cyclohydrolase
MARRLDGKALAATVKARAREGAAALPRRPGLAVILVGDDPASRVYVSGKEKDCAECGFLSFEHKLPAETTQEELLSLVRRLNEDPAVDGILCQLPLPAGLNGEAVINAIAPDKDVDCFHPVNVGRMVIGEPAFLPCTPAGVMALLRAYDIPVRGKRCVVLGRSNIVGKPMAALLTQADGTVTLCHSRTENLPEVTRQADIVVSAVGKPGFLTGRMIKAGAVVIDVAMNRDGNGKLCGDADFAAVEPKAAYITPVPGGVGPMTRAMLMENLLTAAKRHMGVL